MEDISAFISYRYIYRWRENMRFKEGVWVCAREWERERERVRERERERMRVREWEWERESEWEREDETERERKKVTHLNRFFPVRCHDFPLEGFWAIQACPRGSEATPATLTYLTTSSPSPDLTRTTGNTRITGKTRVQVGPIFLVFVWCVDQILSSDFFRS